MASQHNTPHKKTFGGTGMNTHGVKPTLTAQMLNWIQQRNNMGMYPRYTDIHDKYKEFSSGSNSFSHHLPNLRNKNTERPCKRYIIKHHSRIDGKNLVGYKVMYREVHAHLESLRKLQSRLNNWLYSTRKNGLHEHETFYTVQRYLNRVRLCIVECTNDPAYHMSRPTLMSFNNMYNTYNITKAN